MKTIQIILLTIFFATNSNAQSPIIDLDTWNGDGIENAYYKDVNNYLNAFEGTWIYTNGADSFKIVLVKKEMGYTGSFYKDHLIGEYQYIENGVEKINTLSNLSVESIHGLWGSSLLKNHAPPVCDTCPTNERRLRLILNDAPRELSARVTLKLTTVGDQPAFEAIIWGNPPSAHIFMNTTPTYTELTVPTGTFVFIKQ